MNRRTDRRTDLHTAGVPRCLDRIGINMTQKSFKIMKTVYTFSGRSSQLCLKNLHIEVFWHAAAIFDGWSSLNDVIKWGMRRGGVGKKTPIKEMDNTLFYDVACCFVKELSLSSYGCRAPYHKNRSNNIELKNLDENDNQIACWFN